MTLKDVLRRISFEDHRIVIIERVYITHGDMEEELVGENELPSGNFQYDFESGKTLDELENDYKFLFQHEFDSMHIGVDKDNDRYIEIRLNRYFEGKEVFKN